MTQYVVTGRPFPMDPEMQDILGHLGVGATLDAKLDSDMEERLISSGVLRKADKADKAEAKAKAEAETETTEDAKVDEGSGSGGKGT